MTTEKTVHTVAELKQFLQNLPDDQPLETEIIIKEKPTTVPVNVEFTEIPSVRQFIKEWADLIDLPDTDIPPGMYRHYKGGLYEVLGASRHTENGELLFTYREVHGTKIWNRPLVMFFDEVLYEGKMVPRFAKVDS